MSICKQEEEGNWCDNSYSYTLSSQFCPWLCEVFTWQLPSIKSEDFAIGDDELGGQLLSAFPCPVVHKIHIIFILFSLFCL